jgi:hypothetical protein
MAQNGGPEQLVRLLYTNRFDEIEHNVDVFGESALAEAREEAQRLAEEEGEDKRATSEKVLQRALKVELQKTAYRRLQEAIQAQDGEVDDSSL